MQIVGSDTDRAAAEGHRWARCSCMRELFGKLRANWISYGLWGLLFSLIIVPLLITFHDMPVKSGVRPTAASVDPVEGLKGVSIKFFSEENAK